MLVGMPIFNHFGKQLRVILSSQKCILRMTLHFTTREERVTVHKDRGTRMYAHAPHFFVTQQLGSPRATQISIGRKLDNYF